MKYNTEDPRWVTFYPQFNSSMFVEKAGYFDERPEIHTSLTQLIALSAFFVMIWYTPFALLLIPFIFFGWGSMYIHLPIKTGIQDSDSAAWGFNYHDNTLWIYIGGGGNFDGGAKWKTIEMPWSLTWVRTSTSMNWGGWYHENSKNRKSLKVPYSVGSDEWLKETRWQETHEFTDKFDNTIVHATIHVKEREWRPIWFKWTKLFAHKRKCLEVEFNQEVGRGKGGWKGGTIGCGYEMKGNETPLECLRRMEKERDF
jgi:hypothetical protein